MMLYGEAKIMHLRDVFYNSDILDKYQEGTMRKIYSNSNETSIAYLVQHDSDKFILKVLKGCAKTNEEADHIISIASQDVETHKNDTPAKSIEFRKLENNGLISLEILYEIEGTRLAQILESTSAARALEIAKKSVDILAAYENNGILHGKINLGNMQYKDFIMKIINFGIPHRSPDEKDENSIGWIPLYLPPEVLNNPKEISVNKIDIYSWGMTMYQFLNKLTNEELAAQLSLFKGNPKNYKNFFDMINAIELTEDRDKIITKFLRNILSQALSENPKERPTFKELKIKFDKIYSNVGMYKDFPIENFCELGKLIQNIKKIEKDKEILGQKHHSKITELKEKYEKYKEETKQTYFQIEKMKQITAERNKIYEENIQEFSKKLDVDYQIAKKDNKNIEILKIEEAKRRLHKIQIKAELEKLPSAEKKVTKNKELLWKPANELIKNLKYEKGSKSGNKVDDAYSELIENKCERIDLHEVDIGDLGGIIIAKGIQKATKLIVLNLMNCGLKGFGMKIIGTALKNHPSIYSILLGNELKSQSENSEEINSQHFNKIQGKSAITISEMIISCKFLTDINLSNCETEENEQQILIRAINRNQRISQAWLFGYNEELVKRILLRKLTILKVNSKDQ